MSSIDYKSKKIDTQNARKLITKIINNLPGNVIFSKHAVLELKNDGLSTVDAWNVLKGTSKIYHEGEFINGSFRYRLETKFILLVVAFWPNGKGMNIITA